MNSLFNMDLMLYLTGIIMLLVAWMTWRDQAHPKRWTSALFWLLFASTFLFSDVLFWRVGKSLTYRIYGVIVVLLALIAGLGGLGSGSHLVTAAGKMSAGITQASRIGRKIFLPALLIPLITVFLSLAAKDWHVGHWFLLDQKNLTLASLLLACLTALLAACWLTRDTPLQAVRESRRLIDAIGWALILPQLLAMLGGVFVVAQTGQAIQSLVSLLFHPENRLSIVLVYCLGMALLTMIMGNAFAAFPVMTAGVALPLLIHAQHANPALVVAIGMFSGYCGTLMTPMAANFNIVPAALLELKDNYQIIKVQIPTALAVLICNICLMMLFAFPA